MRFFEMTGLCDDVERSRKAFKVTRSVRHNFEGFQCID